MPDKQLTIATYAAGASLAAITLVYVFAPTFFIDGDATGPADGRKRGVVGLLNTANDCFVNSVLQALAGLGDLRIYLIRETHRRNLDGKSVYSSPVEDPRRKLPAWKLEGLQNGIVTQGLKEMLDALNERPLYKKTISAAAFVRCLEEAFRQRISRQQQDAQEFLQVVAERLCDEYHAGHRARRARHSENRTVDVQESSHRDSLDQQLNQLAVEGESDQPPVEKASSSPKEEPSADSSEQNPDQMETAYDEEEGFPLEGQFESQIECLTCGFKPKPSSSTFCTLTLNVPQVSSTSLNTCFDGMFKTEYIDDFKCEKCRLVHAVETFQYEIRKSNSEKFKTNTQRDIDSLKVSIETDPEQPPVDIRLPDTRFAPKRRIARHIRITKFPKIMAIHLSRSIFDADRSSMKNSAKVSFPERLPLGGLLDQKKYKLLGLVTHKGSHQSGHYESFRRQNVYPPFSTPNTFEKSGVYSKSGTPTISTASTPQLSAIRRPDDLNPSTSDLLSPDVPSTPQTSSRVSLASSLSSPQTHTPSDALRNLPDERPKRIFPPPPQPPTSHPRDPSTIRPTTTSSTAETSSIRSVARSARSTLSRAPNSISRSLSRSLSRSSTHLSPSSRPASSSSSPPTVTTSRELTGTNENHSSGDAAGMASTLPSSLRPRRRKTSSDRWWRISDEKIKESKTAEVLGMQREVYLLFYELEKVDDF